MLKGTTDPKCVLAYPFAYISGAGNSRLSGPASGGTRHHRRYPSLVGARRLHSKVGPKNCRDRRATRRTRFSRRKTIFGRENILPHHSTLFLHASAIAADGVKANMDKRAKSGLPQFGDFEMVWAWPTEIFENSKATLSGRLDLGGLAQDSS